MAENIAPSPTGTGTGLSSTWRDGLREDTLNPDPLLDCLVELTRLHGRPSTRSMLAAGLPLDKHGLTPSLFHRAAARAGFASKVTRQPFARIEPILLPMVLLLAGDRACLLLEVAPTGGKAVILRPETGQGRVEIAADELERQYTGIAILARPRFRFDQRTPEVGKVRSRNWFWNAALAQAPVYRDILSAAVLINLFALALPLFTMNVYDRVVPNFAEATLWMLSGGLSLVVGADYMLRVLRGHFVDLAGSRIDLQLSTQLMERVLGMKLADRPASVGSFAANMRSFETIRDFVASASVTAIIDLPFVLFFLAVMAWISPPMVLLPAGGMLFVLIYSYIIQHKMHELAETGYRASALRNATLVESLAALETLKAHCAEGPMQRKWEQTAAFLSRNNGQLRLLSSTALNGVATTQQLVNVSMLILGVYLIQGRELSVGALIACTMLASRVMAPISQVIGLMMQFQSARTAWLSLNELMTRPGERADEAGLVHVAKLRGVYHFHDVHFTYPGQRSEAIRGVSFQVEAGERVVVLGRVGSGKTSLQKLMMGLYRPDAGTISVDGIDLRQIDPVDLRHNIGYVGQDPVLFFGTMRENIAIAAPYANDEAVIRAAEIGGLGEFIRRHPDGFDMQIGERGDTLSGGQRQGVAIARALLLDPPILLLDEATSGMDFSTEAQFKRNLLAQAEGKTMVIVTHRNSLIDLATRLIVMDGGKIVADGPRDTVLAALKAGKVSGAA